MTGSPELKTAVTNPDQWVDRYSDSLFRYALTRLRRRQDAEDVVQETLLAALQAHRAFRGDSAEKTWLIGILRHKIVDRIRVVAREDTAETVPAGEMDKWCGKTDRWLHAPKAWSGDPAKLCRPAGAA